MLCLEMLIACHFFGENEHVESGNLVSEPLGLVGSSLSDYQLTRDREPSIRRNNP